MQLTIVLRFINVQNAVEHLTYTSSCKLCSDDFVKKTKTCKNAWSSPYSTPELEVLPFLKHNFLTKIPRGGTPDDPH